MTPQFRVPQQYKGSQSERVKAVLAPTALKVESNYLKVGDKFVKTFFVLTYPRFLSTGWVSPIINLPKLLDVSIFIHPIDTAIALHNLRRQVTNVEAQIMEREEKGLIRDPILETAYRDIEDLRDSLQQAREKLFDVGLYISIYGDSLEELSKTENEISSLLESRLVYIKPSLFRQVEGFYQLTP